MRAVDEQALFQRFGNVRSAIDVQIDADHQAFAANFADEIEFGGHFFQAGFQLGAARANIGQQMFLFDRVEKRQARGARQRPAAKRGAVKAGRKGRGKFLAREERAERQSARQRFCDDDDVRQPFEDAGRQTPCPCAQGRIEFRRRSAPRHAALRARARASRIPG